MATETQTISSGHSAPIQKFSRYRSVRQAAAKPQIPPSTVQASSSSQNESVQRSMSRYRRRPSKPDPPSSPPVPQQDITPARIAQSRSASLAALTGEPYTQDPGTRTSPSRKDVTSRPRRKSSSKNAISPKKINPTQITPQAHHTPPLEDPPQPRQVSWEALCAARANVQSPQGHTHQEPSEILAEEEERLHWLKAQQAAERAAKLEKRRAVEAEERRRREQIDAEQGERQRMEHQRQEQAGQDTQQRQGEQPKAFDEKELASKKDFPGLKRGNSIRQRLGTFTRKKSAELLGHDRIQKLPEKHNLSASRRTRGMVTKSRPGSASLHNKSEALKDPIRTQWVDAPVSKPIAAQSPDVGPSTWVDAPITRQTPPDDGPVVLPQYDAPVSAVNAGERHVLVKSNVSSRTFPVTPTTTPKDLINSASLVMSESIDPHRSKLVESFTQLGLERPLRDYEHIRDVMNSWDNDAQNSFAILPVANDDQNNHLDATAVPQEQPADISVFMYHSQRPGTWDKRWITLKPDGQVTVAKRQGQQTSNICHLTDFDVYTPTHRQQTKKIRPPKKICFAVKSQQKSSMFLDGANFVHFFATNDQLIASEWYKAVQGWRSWYLVNILGEGQKPKRASTTTAPTRPGTAKSRRRASMDASPYQLGSFKPLLDFEHGDPTINNPMPGPRETKSADIVHARKMSNRDRAPPPSAFPNKLSKDADSGAPTTNQHRSPSIVKGPKPEDNNNDDDDESSTFAPTGLLGRTYSHRQKAQREREANHTSNSPARNSSMRSSLDPPSTSALTRKPSSKSVRGPLPKPLVDLTPTFHEPPQHLRKGRGVPVEPGRQLVDIATGWDLPPTAIVTPSAKAWRRPPPAEGQASPPPPNEQAGAARKRGLSVDTPRPLIPREGARPRPSVDASRPADNEPFIEGGLLARTASKRAQGAGGTGHGVWTGDRNVTGKPMVDLQVKSRFVDGSLLRRVEVQTQTGGEGPAGVVVVDRERRREEIVRTGEGV